MDNNHGGFDAGLRQWILLAILCCTTHIHSCFCAGSSSNIKLLQDLYGVGDESEALVLAEKLSKVLLPARRLVVSPGDVIADNGLYMYHRASANCGMSGGAVRSLDHPQLLLGTHIGASGEIIFAWQHCFCCLTLNKAVSARAKGLYSANMIINHCLHVRVCYA